MTIEEYNQIVYSQSDALYRFALKNIKVVEDAQEIVQTSFEKLWLNRHKADPTKYKAYLFKIAYNSMIDIIRKQKNEVDMEIIVEGHTDTDKFSSSTYPKDNWDLSVLRATEVIKILTANSNIKPAMLSAAGRSEYHPVNAADKAKNRRIEVKIDQK